MSNAADLLNAAPRLAQSRYSLTNERRLARAARDLWQRSGGLQIAEFADNVLVIVDPAGNATIIHAGAAIKTTFGLAAWLAGNNGPVSRLAGDVARARSGGAVTLAMLAHLAGQARGVFGD